MIAPRPCSVCRRELRSASQVDGSSLLIGLQAARLSPPPRYR